MAKTLPIDDPDVIDWYLEISSHCTSSFFLVVLPFSKKTYLFHLGNEERKGISLGNPLQNFKIK